MNPLQTFIHNLHTIFNKVPESILISDEKHKIVFANKSFSAFSGFELKLLIGKSVSFVFDKEGLQEINKHLKHSYIEELKLPFHFTGSRKRKLNVLCFDLMISSSFTGRMYIPEPLTEGISTSEKDQFLKNILRVMDSRKNAAWFITDVTTGKNLYTSESVDEVIGWQPRHFNLGGYGFFFSLIHPDDLVDFRDRHLEWTLLNNKLGSLFEKISFSKNVRLKGMNNQYKYFHAESNVLEYSPKGKVKLEFGSFQEISKRDADSKTNTRHEDHIRLVDGKVFVEVEYLKELKRQYLQSKNGDSFKSLTTREKEILQLVVDTSSSKDISEKLDLSIHTVNLYRKQIMKKLQAKNLAELVRIYYQNK